MYAPWITVIYVVKIQGLIWWYFHQFGDRYDG